MPGIMEEENPPPRAARSEPYSPPPPTVTKTAPHSRTVNGELIGSKRNHVKHASRARIASLIRQQLKQDRTLPQRAATKERTPSFNEFITYHAPSPKGNPSPIPITQDEADEIAPAAIPWRRKSPRVNYISPRGPAGIGAAALHQFMGNAFLEEMKRTTTSYHPLGPEEVANGVVHPVTKETITKYKTLINDPLLRDVWSKAMCKELGRLCQGYGDTEGTSTMQFLDKEEISNIPRDRVVTYARIVVDYRQQKKDPNRVRITAGGNLLKGQYEGELTTRTSDLTTSKCLWNSVISTKGAKYMCADASNFYLATPLEKYQYMKIPVNLIPQEFINLYKLQDKIKMVLYIAR